MTNTPASPTVLLVNEQDNVLGTAEKLSVHESGDLHRAFSVLVFNEQGDYLLQQRAFEKYHSGGLWSNSCCGHPSQPDNTAAQANQRLYEEMGFRTDLQPLFSFQYHAQLPNGLTEHELDHVFTGQYEGPVPFNPDEVCAVRWIAPDALAREMEMAPETFSVWFRMLFERLQKSA
ncbi:isopentenyl-diphosphate Delta-isomerase [Spirosoma sp. RP8]|uniref:Isopentenyl-diphosphate delta-isomerase n=1 Tax=Spirosoma liriopis TaxID=2937440 RepID=A0ABT0HGP4_9BACT|nr:isopentenyl-diphosphate Delta-isomerase [Spirosoma liriopis]MCK8491155.1 isopentenyl-diphosphate Delta-isomerase [Spirosoma liriopis]